MAKQIDDLIVEADDSLEDVKEVLASVKKELKRLIVPLLYAKRITPPSKESLEELQEAVDEVKLTIKDWQDRLGEVLSEIGE